jgi:hypothetical protein
MNIGRTLLLIVAVAVLAALLATIYDYLTVDKCLDAGGRWDKPQQRCVH